MSYSCPWRSACLRLSFSTILNRGYVTFFFGELGFKFLNGGIGSLPGFWEFLYDRLDSLYFENLILLDDMVLLGRKLCPMHLQLLQILLLNFQSMFLLCQTFHELLADGLLMVAQNGHLLIGLIVAFDLFLHGEPCQVAFLELLLKSGRGVVGTEHLGSQSLHLRFEVVVEGLCIDLVEEIVLRTLVCSEGLDGFPNAGNDLHRVDVSHGVLTQKVKLDFIVLN